MMENRRRFTRVIFKRPALLIDGDQSYTCQLLDLSLNGALTSTPANFDVRKGMVLILRFRLADSDIDISMETEVTHIEADHIGLKCLLMDLDSATHLKRLIELNVGDDALLHRELAELIAEHQH